MYGPKYQHVLLNEQRPLETVSQSDIDRKGFEDCNYDMASKAADGAIFLEPSTRFIHPKHRRDYVFDFLGLVSEPAKNFKKSCKTYRCTKSSRTDK